MIMEQDTDTGAAATGTTGKIKRFAPLIVIGGGLGLAYAFGLQDYFSLEYLAESREMLREFVSDNYVLSLLGFGLVYAIATAVAFPAASILSIFIGFLFGWFIGGIVVAFAATAGASALFIAAKTAFRDTLKKKLGPRTKNLAEGFEKDALGYLFVLRLAPVVPFFVTNIAPAFFDVRLRDYVIATFFGILPGVFAYTFLGQGVESVLIAAEQSGMKPSVADLVTPQITLAFVALAVVAAIPVIIRKLRARKS